MLVELHNQGQDRFVYTCNECKHHVETRWHCTVCEVKPFSNGFIFEIFISISLKLDSNIDTAFMWSPYLSSGL